MYTREQVEAAVKAKGYRWFESGDYNVNIVGIRNMEAGERVTNKFDDHLTISYKIDDDWFYEIFDCTTDPGDDWMDKPMNSKGCAIMKPGQYPKSHKLRLHQGRYLALGQQSPVSVYRDRNKDGKYDFDESTVDTGLYGINIHRATKHAGKKSTRVDKWSAGCQVIASNDDWHCFLDICQTAREKWSNNFTYTLLKSTDLKL
tara:strand:+ start:600 stop:1205 length:606 start_codon:yes stop_codon:yes gene_type:complete